MQEELKLVFFKTLNAKHPKRDFEMYKLKFADKFENDFIRPRAKHKAKKALFFFENILGVFDK